MPSPPRILLNKSVILVTARVEEGLPFVPTVFLNLIFWSVIARAQSLYSTTICHLIIMGNHVHFIMVVDNPESIVRFMERFKTETAHAINRLLGRKKRTVWCDDYDAVPMLTIEDAVTKIAYLYTNPQNAGLVKSIEEYPGVNSWKMFESNELNVECSWIRRTFISKLKTFSVSLSHQKDIANELVSKATKKHSFTLSPNAWMGCFGIKKSETEIYNARIRASVREQEASLLKTKKSFIGQAALTLQPLNKSYSSKKFSPRMYCICHDIPLRIGFIYWIKGLLSKARGVYQRWKQGDFSIPYPPELFPPRFPRIANAIVY